MSVTGIWKLDKVVLPSSVVFSQVESGDWNAGIQSMLERPAGHPFPMFTAVQEQQPELQFQTSQLATLLGAIGVGGASLGSTTSYLKAGATTGSAARDASSHRTITIAESVGYWSRITLPHNGKGTADVVIAANYNGTNDPFVHAAGTTLAGNLTATEFFGAGPASLNGSDIGAIKEITIESGVRLIREGGGSELWPTWTSIQEGEPVVTIRTLHAVNWATLGLSGLALNGTSGLTFFARKYAANGRRVSNATAEHIKFVCALGSALPVSTSGQTTSPVSDTLRCQLVAADDSSVPLTGTTASAIT